MAWHGTARHDGPWRAGAGASAGGGSTAWPLSIYQCIYNSILSHRRVVVTVWHGTVARAWQIQPGVCFLAVAAAVAAVLLRRGGVGYSASTDDHGSTWL